MENFTVRPGDDDPRDVQPTQQFWPTPDPAAGYGHPGGSGYGAPGSSGFGGSGSGGPGGAGGPGDRNYWPGSPGGGPDRAKDRRRPRRWLIGAVTAAVLAAGGLTAGLALTSHSPAPGPTGQAAALNAVLSSNSLATANPGGANSGTNGSNAPGAAGSRPCAHAARAARAAGRPRLARILARGCRRRLVLRALLRGVHGQFTFFTKNGTRTLAFERGTVSSVAAGHNFVVRASDGTTWTWSIVANTVVRSHGSKGATSALSAGETVWVGGPVAGSARDARLVIILRARASSASSGPAANSAGAATNSAGAVRASSSTQAG